MLSPWNTSSMTNSPAINIKLTHEFGEVQATCLFQLCKKRVVQF